MRCVTICFSGLRSVAKSAADGAHHVGRVVQGEQRIAEVVERILHKLRPIAGHGRREVLLDFGELPFVRVRVADGVVGQELVRVGAFEQAGVGREDRCAGFRVRADDGAAFVVKVRGVVGNDSTVGKGAIGRVDGTCFPAAIEAEGRHDAGCEEMGCFMVIFPSFLQLDRVAA